MPLNGTMDFVLTYRTRAMAWTIVLHGVLLLPLWGGALYGLGVHFDVPLVDLLCAATIGALVNIPTGYYALWWLNGRFCATTEGLSYRVWNARTLEIRWADVTRVDKVGTQHTWPLCAEHAWSLGRENHQLYIHYRRGGANRKVTILRVGLTRRDLEALWGRLREGARPGTAAGAGMQQVGRGVTS